MKQESDPGRFGGEANLRKEKQFFVAVIIVCLLAIILGFFLNGGKRGLNVDDYSHRAHAFDYTTGGWRPTLVPAQANFRPIEGVLVPNLAHALPRYEFPVRLAILLVHVANVALLGLLAWRLVPNRLVLVAVLWLFLIPVLANEAVVRFCSSAVYPPSLLVFMLGLHASLNACLRDTSTVKRLVFALLGIGLWATTALIKEIVAFLVLVLPLIVGFLGGWNRKRLRRAFLICVSTFALFGAWYYFVLRHSTNLSSRGGVELNLLFLFTQRVPALLKRLVWLIGRWGFSGPLPEAMRLGFQEWMGTYWGWLLALGFLVALLAAVLLSQKEERTGGAPDAGAYGSLLITGVLWTALVMCPILVMRRQIVEIRTLYPAWVGLSLVIAGLLGLMVDVVSRWFPHAGRVLLLALGMVLLAHCFTMAGLVRLYDLRWRWDQDQIQAFRRAVPEIPSTEPVWLLPVTLDENCASAYLGRPTMLDRYLLGVFETPWSASGALRMEYRQQNINAVASHRWGRLHITDLVVSPTGEIERLVVQGREVPVRSLIAFTFREGEVILLDPLVLVASNGDEVIVDLPLTKRYSSMRANREAIRLPLE